MLKAIRDDILKIGSLELRVVILEDGQRMIEAESFKKFWEDFATADIKEGDAEEFAKFIRGQS